jgi:ABC-2 type transport system ATP-binding protein
MEVLLATAEQMDRVVEVVRRHIEPDAEITRSAAEAVVRFQTALRETELAGLLAALVAAGVGVTQFREVQTDLEEAFMTVARSADEKVGDHLGVPADRSPDTTIRSREARVRGERPD